MQGKKTNRSIFVETYDRNHHLRQSDVIKHEKIYRLILLIVSNGFKFFQKKCFILDGTLKSWLLDAIAGMFQSWQKSLISELLLQGRPSPF